jgi:poly(A)-specific ribonuclease
MFEVVEEALVKINDFLQNSTKKTMEILTPSSIHKKAIEKAVRREFNGYVGCTWKRTCVELEKLTEEGRNDSLRLSRSNVLRDELNELIGFRKVIDALIEAKKPLVGHNMLHGKCLLMIDLCHIFHHFYRSIPVEFEDFQSQIHEIFPVIIDTKMIAYSAPSLQSLINNTTLGDIARIFDKDPFQNPKIVYGREFENYMGTESCHEAAYDAYITGLCLLRTTSHILNHSTSTKLAIDPEIHHVNKIFFMQSLSTFMSLEGPHGN